MRPCALVGSDDEAFFPEFVIDLSKCLQVFLQGLAVEEDLANVSSRKLAHFLENESIIF